MRKLPVALTIAGSDSGGGAGVQADLKTFAALGVHGTSAVTCLTAQNPQGVLGVSAVEPAFVKLQMEAVFKELPSAAVKTGMLYSARIIREVREFFERRKKRPPIVIDPVMVATSGAMLLEPDAVLEMTRLFSLATVVTPNLDEAEVILQTKIASVEALRVSARELSARFGCAVLAKGGHLATGGEAIDFFYDGKTELMLSARRVNGVKTHGTGCTYSAAIAAELAKGMKLEKAVVAAKEYVTRTISKSVGIGKHQALGWTATNRMPRFYGDK
jgi:hydroxymethylpyrimidine/phosphomethylpyrimidine kinase